MLINHFNFRLEKENNSKLYLESCEKVSTLTNDYENSVS